MNLFTLSGRLRRGEPELWKYNGIESDEFKTLTELLKVVLTVTRGACDDVDVRRTERSP